MGLDNGIIARKSNDEKANNKLLALNTYIYSDGDHEIAYWRKCWNVRKLIFNALGAGYEDEYQILLNREDILKIIRRLKKLNKKTWDERESIWSWEEHKRSHRGNVRRLRRLARLMRKYPDIEVYFYDSY